MDLSTDRPGAYMAPNFVYPCSGSLCFTERLDLSQPALARSCGNKTGACADAVTRGLLSQLTPILGAAKTESVLPATGPVKL